MKKINIPNLLVLIRIALIIPFVIIIALYMARVLSVDISFYLGGSIFLIASVTDLLDGYLARKNNQVTSFGKTFDNLADKMLINTALILLTILNIVPFYLILIIILRDVVVGGLRILKVENSVSSEANIYGKLKTLFQTISILLIFFAYPSIETLGPNLLNIFSFRSNPYAHWSLWILNIPIIFVTILSLVSGTIYLKETWSYLKFK